MRRRSILLICSAALVVSCPRFAVAQDAPQETPSKEPDTDPDQLFAEATALMTEEKWPEAIPKLEEAQRRDPGIGTQFNLAVCYSKTGRLALAWKNLVQVEQLAKAAGKKQREAAARAVLDELAPRISRVIIRVGNPSIAGLTIRVDGEPIAPADMELVPLDPGEHRIDAEAAGRKPFETTVVIAAEGERHEIVVPALDVIEPKTEIRTVEAETSNTRRTLGFVFGGVGVAGVITATVTGILLLNDKSTADDHCKPNCVTATGEVDQEGVDAVQRGKTLLPINAIAWGVAAVGLGAGAFFILTSSKKQPPKTALVPAFDAKGGYALFTRSF